MCVCVCVYMCVFVSWHHALQIFMHAHGEEDREELTRVTRKSGKRKRTQVNTPKRLPSFFFFFITVNWNDRRGGK